MDNKLAIHYTFPKLLKFTLPTICMMIFTSIYTIVDGYFISNYVGKVPFASVNLVFPFIMIMSSLGFMIGTGGCAIVGRLLGQGKKEEANKVFTMMIKFTLILGVITSILGVLFTRQISILLGATEEMLEYCVSYGVIINAFNFAFMLQYLFQSFFVTATKPKLGFIITTIAGVTNIILDWLFVAIFKWGVEGAAIASCIGQVIGGFYPVYYFSKENDSLLRITHAKFEAKYLINACTNGSSELMSSISSSLVGMLYNFQLLKYAGQDGVAAYGVIMYTQMIFQAIYLGYTIGSTPIVSYNYGSENHDELHNIFTKSLKLIGITGICMFILCFTSSSEISKIFVGYDEGLMEITIDAFKIYALAFIFSGFNIYASGFFTALGNGKISALISFLRCLVFQVICVLILPLILDMNGIWWALSVAEILSLFVSITCLIKFRNHYHYA